MRSLSIRQPWSALVAAGRKVIEVRSWPTDHRGPLLIVASSTADRAEIKAQGLRELDCPRGVAVAIVDVVGCERMPKRCPRDVRQRILDAAWCMPSPGDCLWWFANVRRVKPFPVKGRLRLFDVPDRLIEVIQPIPACAEAMGCLCAGHARGNPADVACDTRE